MRRLFKNSWSYFDEEKIWQNKKKKEKKKQYFDKKVMGVYVDKPYKGGPQEESKRASQRN